jgi:hypothetical protein
MRPQRAARIGAFLCLAGLAGLVALRLAAPVALHGLRARPHLPRRAAFGPARPGAAARGPGI